MISYLRAVNRWRDVEYGIPMRLLKRSPMILQEGRIIGDRDTELVRTIRRPSGSILCWLLNGDGGISLTFTNQQRAVRAALQGNKEPAIILPYSALEAASIDFDSIRPLEVRADRWEDVRVNHKPWDLADVVWETNPTYQYGRIKGRRDIIFHRRTAYYDYATRDYIPDPNPEVIVRGLPSWQFVEEDSDGFYTTVRQHWLGDSVFSAVAHGARRTFISSFDYQERFPLYYLAELPWHTRGHVKTVEAAIDALAPRIVHAALAQEREVLRQGDMFAIPTSLSTKDVKSRARGELRRMQGVFGTDHLITESYVCKGGVTYGRGWIHHKPQFRPPDHGRTYLGKTWHLIVPNAVPRRRAGAMVRG